MKDNIKANNNLLNNAHTLYEISILLDFYGQLLTKRQYEILDMHYNNDLSFGEIAEELGISRQGVYDSIHKGKIALTEYEKNLGLAARFKTQEESMIKALKSLKQVEQEIPEVTKSKNFIDAVKTLGKVLDSL